MLKGSHSIFFMFVGDQEGLVWDHFYAAAENFQEHGFFYATSPQIAAEHFEQLDNVPAIVVYKEEQHDIHPNAHIFHEMDSIEVNHTIHEWVNRERFLTFPKITRFNLHQLMKTKKNIVLAVVTEDKLNQVATHELEFRDMIENVIRKNRHKYHNDFQFGWVGLIYLIKIMFNSLYQ